MKRYYMTIERDCVYDEVAKNELIEKGVYNENDFYETNEDGYPIEAMYEKPLKERVFDMEEKKFTYEIEDEMEDILIEFDEYGFAPTITMPYSDAEEYAKAWKNRLMDLFHRLQSEKAEYEQKLADGELVSKDWHDEQVGHAELVIEEQKAEIERLTYENRTTVSISNGFALERNNLRDEVNELKKEKRHLQKQVDELSQANIDLWHANQLGVKYAKNPYKGVEVE